MEKIRTFYVIPVDQYDRERRQTPDTKNEEDKDDEKEYEPNRVTEVPEIQMLLECIQKRYRGRAKIL